MINTGITYKQRTNDPTGADDVFTIEVEVQLLDDTSSSNGVNHSLDLSVDFGTSPIIIGKYFLLDK